MNNLVLIIGLVFWALANLADIWTTLLAIKAGAHEANPELTNKAGGFAAWKTVALKACGAPLIFVGWHFHLPIVTACFAGGLSIPAAWASWHNWRLARKLAK